MINKLDILFQAGVINSDIYTGMQHVIEELEILRGSPLPEEQGWMAMAHLANALMRSHRGEVIPAVDAEIASELEATGQVDYLRQINQQLLARFPVVLHPNEEGYLLVNLYGLCGAEHHRSGLAPRGEACS